MPGNLKRARAGSAVGAVNTDLTRTQAPADPRFYEEPGLDGPAQPTGLTVTGKSPNAKISARPQRLPVELDTAAKPKRPFTPTPRQP